MADKVPVKGTFDSAGEADGLSEFVSGDTVPYTHGGTGLSALGSALTVLRTNAAGNAIEWGAASDGDITAVNTAGTSGLSGGATSGAANLTIAPNSATSATVTTSDIVLIGDADDSNAVKKTTVQDILNLSSGGASIGMVLALGG